ncbi:MAG: helix-turn-helix domain-containing protein [Kofleriaceae bacterium]
MTERQGAKMEKRTNSAFAVVLRSLLDDHGTMRRAEWAEVLGVSEAAISQWLNDSVIPKAENLRAIMSLLIADRRVPSQALETFESVMRRPSTEVSPNGDRMKPTVSHYLIKPLREAFLRTLETLPPEAQEVVLLDAAARCREIRAAPIVRRSIEERRRLQFESLIEEATGSSIQPGLQTPTIRMPADATVSDRDLQAQSWMQDLLLISVTGRNSPSITRPLGIARKASVTAHKRQRPFDNTSVWKEATDALIRGVRDTIIAADQSGGEVIAT